MTTQIQLPALPATIQPVTRAPINEWMLCPILLGGDAQVATGVRLLAQAHTGHGQIVLNSGGAGSGEPRLVEEFARFGVYPCLPCG